jgi:hypothetical protein
VTRADRTPVASAIPATAAMSPTARAGSGPSNIDTVTSTG